MAQHGLERNVARWLSGSVDIVVPDPYDFNLIDPLPCFRAGQSEDARQGVVVVGGERVAEKSSVGLWDSSGTVVPSNSCSL